MTPHIQAKKGEVAKTVLMPGDPLRAKFIAENFLEDVRQFNAVRNMLGYTGSYQGQEVSVMGSGMGIPSIGIYSHELYHMYDVDNIIRIGSAGAYDKKLELFDLVIGLGASTNSNFAQQFDLPGSISALCSYELLKKTTDTAERLEIPVHVGNILSSDIFYNDQPSSWKKWMDLGILAVEMEAYGLYLTAAKAGKNALCILTISDSFHFDQITTAQEREQSFTQMMTLALEAIK